MSIHQTFRHKLFATSLRKSHNFYEDLFKAELNKKIIRNENNHPSISDSKLDDEPLLQHLDTAGPLSSSLP